MDSKDTDMLRSQHTAPQPVVQPLANRVAQSTQPINQRTEDILSFSC